MKNIISALSDFYKKSCQERQEFLIEQWTKPAADREFYDILNACCSRK